jgi:hypothetical protein
MLSDDLGTLAGHFEGWAAIGGVGLNATACLAMAAVLRTGARDAEGLLAQPVPAALRLPVIPSDVVVSLDAVRASRSTPIRAAAPVGAA